MPAGTKPLPEAMLMPDTAIVPQWVNIWSTVTRNCIQYQRRRQRQRYQNKCQDVNSWNASHILFPEANDGESITSILMKNDLRNLAELASYLRWTTQVTSNSTIHCKEVYIIEGVNFYQRHKVSQYVNGSSNNLHMVPYTIPWWNTKNHSAGCRELVRPSCL